MEALKFLYTFCGKGVRHLFSGHLNMHRSKSGETQTGSSSKIGIVVILRPKSINFANFLKD